AATVPRCPAAAWSWKLLYSPSCSRLQKVTAAGRIFRPAAESMRVAAVETDASIPAAWPQSLDIFGTRIVVEPSSDQLSGDAGRQLAGATATVVAPAARRG